MEEIELRDALRQHVQQGEPPLAMTAAGLISKARTQNRFRLGLRAGSGGAAAALAVLVALSLNPLGGGGPPAWDASSCSLPEKPGWSAGPSAPPEQPVTPTDIPPDYSPGHTEPAHTGSADPVTPPTGTPSPEYASDLPLFTDAPPPADPSIVPSGMDLTKRDLLDCYLARAFHDRLPYALYGKSSDYGPMEVYGTDQELFANGVIVDPSGSAQVWLIFGRQKGEPILDLNTDFGWSRTDTAAGIFLVSPPESDMLQICLFTGTTEVLVFASRGVLDAADFMEMLSAPEANVFS